MMMKAYILSGGKSTRMSEEKGLKLLLGKPLITYLIETLTSLNFEICIIANDFRYSQFGLPVIQDLIAEKGPLGGIFTALYQANEDILIISVDTPFFEKKHIKNLVEDHQKNTITLAHSEGKLYPLFGVYPFLLIDKMKFNIENNYLKLMKFVEENDYHPIDLDFSELEKLNINTIDDIENAKKMIENGN